MNKLNKKVENPFKGFTVPLKKTKPIIKLSIWVRIPAEYVTICNRLECKLDDPIKDFVKKFVESNGNLRVIIIESKQ